MQEAQPGRLCHMIYRRQQYFIRNAPMTRWPDDPAWPGLSRLAVDDL